MLVVSGQLLWLVVSGQSVVSGQRSVVRFGRRPLATAYFYSIMFKTESGFSTGGGGAIGAGIFPILTELCFLT